LFEERGPTLGWSKKRATALSARKKAKRTSW
jgi:hypothetical protein